MAWVTIAGDGESGGLGGARAYRVEGMIPANQGQNNDVFFGRSGESGAPVVVKIEGAPGRLDAEAGALAWLSGRGVPAPRLLHRGRIRAAHGYGLDVPPQGGPRSFGGRFALVQERLPGRAPTAPGDWRVMGEALAGLTAVRLPDAAGLTVCAPEAFVAAHEALGRALAEELPAPYGEAVQGAVRAAGSPPELSRPVLTHGDPGPGNFLRHGTRGALLDWETVLAAPAGLDPARASFLALLGAGGRSAGHAARARACAAAVWAGYGAAGDGPVPPGARRWWTAVAGAQFVANRWYRRTEPRILPWEDAVTTWTAASTSCAGAGTSCAGTGGGAASADGTGADAPDRAGRGGGGERSGVRRAEAARRTGAGRPSRGPECLGGAGRSRRTGPPRGSRPASGRAATQPASDPAGQPAARSRDRPVVRSPQEELAGQSLSDGSPTVPRPSGR